MNPHLRYAIGQLTGICFDALNRAGQYSAVDRIERALQALDSLDIELRAIAKSQAASKPETET
jgi:hypothetical protein